MKSLALRLAGGTAGILLVLVPASASPEQGDPARPLSQAIERPFAKANHREFDFWLGEWDVNLRIRQEDGTWVDAKKARTKVYSILDGKALLELWDEKVESPGIRGFSLRYYDEDQQEWVLYLNWPQKNRSTTGRLTGSFRHGRGEFFAKFPNPQGEEVLARYTFSDIAPDRLRWDDAFSKDGGLTWSNNWIMEFTRAAPAASWPETGGAAHTYHTGERCDREEFRAFERLAGKFSGHVTAGETSSRATLTGFKVLDGCGVITMLEYEAGGKIRKEFALHTFQTRAGAFEETLLDNQPGTKARQLYGDKDGDTIDLRSGKDAEPKERYLWTFESGGKIHLEAGGAGDVDEWRPRWEANFESQPG